MAYHRYCIETPDDACADCWHLLGEAIETLGATTSPAPTPNADETGASA